MAEGGNNTPNIFGGSGEAYINIDIGVGTHARTLEASALLN